MTDTDSVVRLAGIEGAFEPEGGLGSGRFGRLGRVVGSPFAAKGAPKIEGPPSLVEIPPLRFGGTAEAAVAT